MKKLFLSTVALAAMASSALAADLPSRKAAPILDVPPPPMWTGFYAGLNAGYGWGTTSGVPVAGIGSNASAAGWSGLGDLFGGKERNALTFGAGSAGLGLANTGYADVNQSGFVGGGQIGYNYQTGAFVIGVEADIQGSAMRGSGRYAGAGFDAYSLTFRDTTLDVFNQSHVGGGEIRAGVDWIGTVRGRVGYTVWPTMLLYVTGGLAYGNVWAQTDFSSTSSTNLATLGGRAGALSGANLFNQTAVGAGRIDETKVGWTIGGGAEWMLDSHWSLKTEALYYDLGSATLNGAGSAAPALNLGGLIPAIGPVLPGTGPLGVATQSRVSFDGVIARVGVNRRFAW